SRRAGTKSSCTPLGRGAAFSFFMTTSWAGLLGFQRTATRRALGRVSCSSSSSLPKISSPTSKAEPVTFPPARARLAPSPDRTGAPEGHNEEGSGRVGVLGGAGGGGGPRHDEVDLEADQLRRQGGQQIRPSLRESRLDHDVLALGPAELAEPLPQRLDEW